MQEKKITNESVTILPTVEKCAQEISALIEGFKPEIRMLILQTVIHKEAEKTGTNPAKLSNGTIGESILCTALGLLWNDKTIQGFDATDKKGEPCEIKTALYKLTPGTMININYKLPERKKKETPPVYLARVIRHNDEITGGHYWGARKGTELVYHWHINGKYMSEFIAKRVSDDLMKTPEQKTFIYNFGGKVCSTCRKIHRIEAIVDRVNARDYIGAVKRVSMNC